MSTPQIIRKGIKDKAVDFSKIEDLTIANGQISASAAIAHSKMAALTASKATVTDGSGVVTVSAVTATELGYLSGTTSNLQSQLNAIESGYARRTGVIAYADATVAPPTEVSGDRYILDDTTGSVHADWDGAAKLSIVQFNGTSWVETVPAEGWVVYVDASNQDYLFVDDGTPAWEARATQSNNLAQAKVWIGDSNGTAVARSISGDITLSDAGLVGIAAGVIVDADISASAAITESKVNLAYGTATLNTSISNHISNTNNPHSVTKSQILTGNLIVNADIDASAAIADTKLATISSANKVSGSAIQLATLSGLEDSTGLRAKVDGATIKRNTSGELEGLKPNLQNISLIAGDITAQYVDLSKLVYPNSLDLKCAGLGPLIQGTSYSLSTEGGVTRITFLNALATGGVCALEAGDELIASYMYLS